MARKFGQILVLAADAFYVNRYPKVSSGGKSLQKLLRESSATQKPHEVIPDGNSITIVTDIRFWKPGWGSHTRILNLASSLSKKLKVSIFFLGSQVEQEQALIDQYAFNVFFAQDFSSEKLPGLPQRPAGFSAFAYNLALRKFYSIYKPATLLVEYLRLHPIVEADFPNSKIVYDIHDVEAQRRESFSKAGLEKHLPSSMSKEEETSILKSADAVVSISNRDTTLLQQNMFATPVFTVGIDSERAVRPVASRRHNRLIFIGGPGFVNIASVRWFVDKVMPIMKDTVRLEIWGGVCNTEAIKKVLTDSRVSLMGSYSRISEVLNSDCVLIAPIVAGGGLKVKVVEMLGTVPVVGSAEAFAGITEIEKQSLELNPQTWKLNLEAILRDPFLRRMTLESQVKARENLDKQTSDETENFILWASNRDSSSNLGANIYTNAGKKLLVMNSRWNPIYRGYSLSIVDKENSIFFDSDMPKIRYSPKTLEKLLRKHDLSGVLFHNPYKDARKEKIYKALQSNAQIDNFTLDRSAIPGFWELSRDGFNSDSLFRESWSKEPYTDIELIDGKELLKKLKLDIHGDGWESHYEKKTVEHTSYPTNAILILLQTREDATVKKLWGGDYECLIRDLVQFAQQRLDRKFIFRPHPLDPEILDNVELPENARVSLGTLGQDLMRASHVVTLNSGSGLIAAANGLPVATLAKSPYSDGIVAKFVTDHLDLDRFIEHGKAPTDEDIAVYVARWVRKYGLPVLSERSFIINGNRTTHTLTVHKTFLW